MKNTFSFPISRREFMKLAGVTMAGVMVGGGGSTKAAAAEKGSAAVDFSKVSLPVLYDVDVCVVGGGAAGTAAAISAGKNGAKTLLVERGIYLGGLATQGCVYPCMPTFAFDSDTPYIKEVNKRMEGQGISP